LAEKKALELSIKLNINLATICPTLVIGPMLQKEVNRSMSAIPNIFDRKTVANDSMSFIDVRDCAAHNINCMEKKLTGIFMSLKESWHWEDIINAVYKIVGRENDAPKFKGDRVKLTKFDDSRMKMLGVNEISN